MLEIGREREFDWKFIEDLKSPLHRRTRFVKRSALEDEADLSDGVILDFDFPDAVGSLETAYADFRLFLSSVGVVEKRSPGAFRLLVRPCGDSDCYESFSVRIDKDLCVLESGDTEGIRRGLVFLEDEMLRSGGPFLPIGVTKRSPMIKTRISRCFFGPIKRPPMNRDELIDDIDYYPDEYLNRLAHEGVNALWLSVSFKDLCLSDIFPEHGCDRERRFEKLRRTVAKCGRYGIKIYPFVIEPCAFGSVAEHQHPLSTLDSHPELAGHRLEDGTVHFCVSSETGKRYLEDCAFQIFSNVPGLGGLIDINMGERPTHCYSWVTAFTGNNCPRCSGRRPWEVVNDTVASLAKGMRRAEPGAEMISWLYVPQFEETRDASIEDTTAVLEEIAAHIPADITFQYNFESMGVANQLGKERMVLDYFLSWPGPSHLFRSCAAKAVSNGASVSAKIQVGCSHELATIPFIPVPGNLYAKYKAMRESGVSAVMQCWYFGNYPGLMNKAAGELSFEPFPESEMDFLAALAKRDWGGCSDRVVEAWIDFQESYSNFPVNLGFTHYGPLHNSIVWPLHLFPVDRPISPSWKFTFPLESGDRIGECLCYDHTLDEALELLDAMAERWRSGVGILNSIRAEFAENRDRLLDIALANAIGLQIESAANVFHFYALREELPWTPLERRAELVERMRRLTEAEIVNSKNLVELCDFDSRLGFHSEAEGYKYDAEQLRLRISRLNNLLEKDFPKLDALVAGGEPLFPEHVGMMATGKRLRAANAPNMARWEEIPGTGAFWTAFNRKEELVFVVKGSFSETDRADLEIEPRRLWPAQRFTISGKGVRSQRNFKMRMDPEWSGEADGERFVFTIPLALFDGFHRPEAPFRVNVGVNGRFWIEKHPFEPRLRFGDDNPADLGWLL